MPLVDYTDIQNDISNAQDPKVLPAGTEAKLRIISVNTGISDKNDCQWFSPLFDVPAEPLCKEFNDFFWHLDKSKLTPKQYELSLAQYKHFFSAFGVDISRPFDWENLVGSEGWAILGVRTDATYGDKNSIKKYIAKK